MPRNCVVGNCYNTSDNRNISFFRFPKGSKQWKLWVKFVNFRRQDFSGVSHSRPTHARICSAHFEKSAFERNCQLNFGDNCGPKFKTRLRKEAVPTIQSITCQETPTTFMTLSSKCKLGYVSGMWQCIKLGCQRHQQLFVMTLQCNTTCEEIKRHVWTGIGFLFRNFVFLQRRVNLSDLLDWKILWMYNCERKFEKRSSLSLSWDEPFYDSGALSVSVSLTVEMLGVLPCCLYWNCNFYGHDEVKPRLMFQILWRWVSRRDEMTNFQ